MPRGFQIPSEAKSLGDGFYEVDRYPKAKATRGNRFGMESMGLKDRYFKQGKLVIKNPTVSTSRVLSYPI